MTATVMGSQKAKDTFCFRRFTIRQDRCAMKVGTDGVLLGAWAELPQKGRILDVGTGTGLIALMAAQRSEAQVTGLEIDADAAAQAAENAATSPWAERITILQGDFAVYPFEERFHCILSNPPFYNGTLLPPDAARCAARHNDALSFATLARRAAELLLPEGTLSVVLPLSEADRFVDAAAGESLFVNRRTKVYTTPAKPPRRLLLTLSPSAAPLVESELILNGENGERHNIYKQLASDFYIK